MVEMNLIQQRATNIFVQTDFLPSSSENNLEIRFHFNFKVISLCAGINFTAERKRWISSFDSSAS